MIKYINTMILLLVVISVFGQSKYEPQILILAPNITTNDKVFDKEISDFNAEIKNKMSSLGQQDIENSNEYKNLSENLKSVSKSEIEFAKSLDFFKQTSMISESYLVYHFYESFPNLLIKLKDVKSNGELNDLKRISENEKLQYVINFSSINIYKEDNISYAKIVVQLYDHSSNIIVLNKSYTGNWNNPGFEFACKDSSLNCTLNNALSKALNDILQIVASNSPTLKNEQMLIQKRNEILINDYYNRFYDKETIKAIILPSDSIIDLNDLYQVLYNDDKTKFVAFFFKQIPQQNFKKLKENNNDKSVTIKSDKDFKDQGFFDEVPQNYAYTVDGVKYNNKWYYEKSNVTYFDAKDSITGRKEFFNYLQQWNFFKDNSNELNSDFWETKLFEKVKDIRKDPKWGKYDTTIWKSTEIADRDYIGLYEIVANGLKKMKTIENDKFNKIVSDSFFRPFIENLKVKRQNEFAKYNILNDRFILIYPKEKKIVLCPIEVFNSNFQRSIRYFLLFKTEGRILEWTYFTQNPVDTNKYKDFNYSLAISVIESLEAVTQWDLGYTTLDDKSFWDNYVLIKSGKDYKYLKEIK